jgi:hypothetical protein
MYAVYAYMCVCLQAKSANENLDFAAALRYGSKAKKFAIVAIVVGIICVVISLILRLIVFTSRVSHTY